MDMSLNRKERKKTPEVTDRQKRNNHAVYRFYFSSKESEKSETHIFSENMKFLIAVHFPIQNY